MLGVLYVTVLTFAPVTALAEYAGILRSWHAIAAAFVITMLFALFPDVDTNSKAQDIFFGIAFVADILLLWAGYIQAAAYLGLIAMLPIITHHRGWTHRKWAALVVPLPILIVPYIYNHKMLAIGAVYYGAAVVGYFSHLLFDGLIWRRFRISKF